MAQEKVTYILQLKDLFSKALDNAKRKTDEFTDGVTSAQSALSSMAKGAAVAFAGIGLANVYSDLKDVTKEFERIKTVLNFISGGEGEETLKYLEDYSNKLGISIQGAVEGYKTIAASARGTNLEGQQTKEIFEGISTAGAALQLDAFQVEGALMAIGQMMSKGKVQAEELRGQLGERIPGAFQIAARAMGMTTAELDKFMADGKLMAEDFLPLFAQQLKTEFAAGAEAAAQSFGASMNRMDNEILKLKQDLGQELKPAFIAVMNATLSFISAIRSAADWVQKNSDVIIVAVAGLTAYALYTNAAAIATWGLNVAVQAAAAAQWLLNAAMTANPIGALILGLTALAAGVVYAWKNFAGFRGAVMGTWAVMKGLVGFIKDFVIGTFTGLANVIAGVFTLDPDQIQKGLDQAVNAYKNFGKQAADAFNKGYDDAVKGFDKEQEKTPYAKPAAKTVAATPKQTPSVVTATAGTAKVQGQKVYTINIDIKSLVDKFEVVTNNINQAPAKIKELITRTMIDAINDAQIVGGQ